MFDLISLALGVGSAVFGASQQKKAIKKSNKATAAANAQQKKVQQQTQIASEASIRAEALREKQMELEGVRGRRNTIRAAQGARALGLARAVGQGVGTGDSGVRSGQQSVRSQERVDLLANLQNIDIGRGIFAENRAITQAQAKGAQFQTAANIFASQAQTSLNSAQTGQQIFGFGLNLATNATSIGNTLQSTIYGRNNVQPTPAFQTNFNSATQDIFR